jgi:hypothetical protein
MEIDSVKEAKCLRVGGQNLRGQGSNVKGWLIYEEEGKGFKPGSVDKKETKAL